MEYEVIVRFEPEIIKVWIDDDGMSIADIRTRLYDYAFDSVYSPRVSEAEVLNLGEF